MRGEESVLPCLEDVRGNLAVNGVQQGVFGIRIGRASQLPHATVRGDQNPPFVQPPFRKLHQVIEGECLEGFVADLPHERPLAPLRQRTKVQELGRPGLMVM